MSLRPVIFISAVSKELQTSRQAVAHTLASLGYEADWQDIFPTDSGSLLAMLRRKVDASRAVFQLVGSCYGAEPGTPTPEFGRVSYTQYEALHARSRGKKVYYLFLADGFSADPHVPEPEELRALQRAYVERIRATGDLRHPVATSADLENRILRLRDELARLRRRTVQWALGVSLALVLLLGLVGKLWHDHRKEIRRAEERHAEVSALARSFTDNLDALRGRLGEGGRDLKDVPREELETLLAAQNGLAVERLRQVVAEAATSKDALTRAAGHLLDGDFDAALAEAAKAGGRKSDLLEQAQIRAQAYAGKGEDEKALAEREKVVALWDRDTDPIGWAHAMHMVAYVLSDLERDEEAEAILREVVAVRTAAGEAEHPFTLAGRHNLANSLYKQRKFEEAEAEHREVLAIRERLLGPEDPDTLMSRKNLSTVWSSQGRHAESEAAMREIVALQTRLLGPEDPATLDSRQHLAFALKNLERYQEAEEEYRAVTTLQARVLGPEQRDTLTSRYFLALALGAGGKFAEAEAEIRSVLTGRERVLGVEHPDTLTARYLLALILSSLERPEESLREAETTYEGRLRALGEGHADTQEAKALVGELKGE